MKTNLAEVLETKDISLSAREQKAVEMDVIEGIEAEFIEVYDIDIDIPEEMTIENIAIYNQMFVAESLILIAEICRLKKAGEKVYWV